MRATTAPAEGNLVHLDVEIDEEEVDGALAAAFRELAKKVTVPGFRPGRVPRQILEVRMGGREALRAEALRDILPGFCTRALVEQEIDPIARPTIDITAGQKEGPVSFRASVQVRPLVAIPGYAGLRVTVPRPAATDQEVDAQIDLMRENEAELVDVDRPVMEGDFVTVDLRLTDRDGREVRSTNDLLYQAGGKDEGEVPGLAEHLVGLSAGDTAEYPAAGWSGPGTSAGTRDDDADDGEANRGTLAVTVKDVKLKVLPELTDEWAAESSECSSIEELRRELAERVTAQRRAQAIIRRREGLIEALRQLVDDSEVPEALVAAAVRAQLDEFHQTLEERRINLGRMLEADPTAEERISDEFRRNAVREVKADLALRALAEAENLQATEAEVLDRIERLAAAAKVAPAEMRDRIEHAGEMGAVRSDVRKLKAVDWLIEHVELVDEAGDVVSREDLVGDGGATPEETDEQQPTGGDEPAGDATGGVAEEPEVSASETAEDAPAPPARASEETD